MTEKTGSAPTLGEALAAFRQASGLTGDDARASSWNCRFGPLTIRLPNFAWRRRAIVAHDLHHVLTGYPCTMRGEFQMAAWEFGAGRMRHWAATVVCLPLVLMGLFWAPHRIAQAYMRGRRSVSLHGCIAIDLLLATPLAVVRKRYCGDGSAPRTRSISASAAAGSASPRHATCWSGRTSTSFRA